MKEFFLRNNIPIQHYIFTILLVHNTYYHFKIVTIPIIYIVTYIYKRLQKLITKNRKTYYTFILNLVYVKDTRLPGHIYEVVAIYIIQLCIDVLTNHY